MSDALLGSLLVILPFMRYVFFFFDLLFHIRAGETKRNKQIYVMWYAVCNHPCVQPM